MIKLTRSRAVDDLKDYSGPKLEEKLEMLLGYFYDGAGIVDFKPKGRQVWRKAKGQLRKETHGKCAYCEADTSVVAHGDVEHFRPKDTYWWLAYCVDNYTFSCQICNQTYKGTKFPITGRSLKHPTLPKSRPIAAAKFSKLAKSLSLDPVSSTDREVLAEFGLEDAHLVNPYLENPERLFAWHADADLKEVRLVSNRAAKSAQAVAAAEDALGLNREELVRLRWKTYSTLETLVLAFLEPRISKTSAKRIIAELEAMAGEEHQFAGMIRYFLKKWKVPVRV